MRAVFAAAVIALAGLAAYCSSLAGARVFDDFGSITDNPTIFHLRPVGPVLSPSHGGLTVSSGNVTGDIVKKYLEEQEGESVEPDGRFQIDSP